MFASVARFPASSCNFSSLLEISKKEGAQRYTLEVRASNEEAISLYECMDFKKCGVRKEYYEDNGEDAIIMWKDERQQADYACN